MFSRISCLVFLKLGCLRPWPDRVVQLHRSHAGPISMTKPINMTFLPVAGCFSWLSLTLAKLDDYFS